MSYLVLARRLRPSRFDDLIGQDTNAEILRNAVISKRVAHAFLFAGSRGVGKTSAARILSRAINCLESDNGNPCNSCLNCIDINDNSSPDIIEIDAASNRGIDNIRELRANVNYVPSRCKYKVYIIDEAHMLTLESFNALLKTLEEPPQYVKFIFATTDPHKIPQTIISRCQRYDFLRISVKQMSDYLEKIIKDEKLEISRKSLEMISQNASGGMRDALTFLDQILSIEEGNVSDEKIAQILGIIDNKSRFKLTEAILLKKDDLALSCFHELLDHGYDVNDILSDLLNTIKTVSLVKSLGIKPALFQDISNDDLDFYQTLAKTVNIDELQQIFQVLLQLEERLKISSHSKICFEMSILQITSIQSLVDINEIINDIKNLRDSDLNKKKIEDNTDLAYKNNKNNTLEKGTQLINTLKSENNPTVFNLNSSKNLLNYDKNEFIGESGKKLDEYKHSLVKSEKKINVEDQKKYIQRDKSEKYFNENSLNSDKKYFNEIKNNLENQYTNLTKPKKTELDEDYSKKYIQEKPLKEQEKPSEEWIRFSEEARKKSLKIASFVRNAIPQSLSETHIKLSFRSGNFDSLLDKKSIEILEKIASDLSGHPIKITNIESKSISPKKTIAEYQKIVLEDEIKLKKQKAIESPQVKKILSVFKNSKISEIKLLDQKNN